MTSRKASPRIGRGKEGLTCWIGGGGSQAPGDTAPEESFADSRRRLASFLSGALTGAQAAGDEVVTDVANDEVDFIPSRPAG